MLALLRSDLELEEEDGALRSLLEAAMRHGTEGLKPELESLYRIACKNSTDEEKGYLPLIEKRVDEGCLAELMKCRFGETGQIKPLLAEMEWALRENKPFSQGLGRCG